MVDVYNYLGQAGHNYQVFFSTQAPPGASTTVPGIVGYAVATGSLVVNPVILKDPNLGSAYSVTISTKGALDHTPMR